MKRFLMEYRIIGYSFSDNFRPNPKWGKKTFWIDEGVCGLNTLEEVEAAARHPEAVPKGYEFYMVREIEIGGPKKEGLRLVASKDRD